MILVGQVSCTSFKKAVGNHLYFWRQILLYQVKYSRNNVCIYIYICMACISYTWHSRGVAKWMHLWCYPARAVEGLPRNPLKTCWILLQRTPNDIQHDFRIPNKKLEHLAELQIGLSGLLKIKVPFFCCKFQLQMSIPIFVLTIFTWGFAHNQTWETCFNPTVFLKRSPKKRPFFEKNGQATSS